MPHQCDSRVLACTSPTLALSRLGSRDIDSSPRAFAAAPFLESFVTKALCRTLLFRSLFRLVVSFRPESPFPPPDFAAIPAALGCNSKVPFLFRHFSSHSLAVSNRFSRHVPTLSFRLGSCPSRLPTHTVPWWRMLRRNITARQKPPSRPLPSSLSPSPLPVRLSYLKIYCEFFSQF